MRSTRVVRCFLVIVAPVVVSFAGCRQELDLGGGEGDASSLADTAADTSTLVPDADEGDASTTDAKPSGGTCGQVCARAAVCGLLDDMDAAGCLPQCESSTTQAQIDCMIQAPCADFLACVGAAPNNVPKCQSRCDSMSFFSCIDATQLATCRARCVSASAAVRDAFIGCGSASQCPQARDCYSVFTK